jgi:hypothetical protein
VQRVEGEVRRRGKKEGKKGKQAGKELDAEEEKKEEKAKTKKSSTQLDHSYLLEMQSCLWEIPAVCSCELGYKEKLTLHKPKFLVLGGCSNRLDRTWNDHWGVPLPLIYSCRSRLIVG